jgi:hypothetical protein
MSDEKLETCVLCGKKTNVDVNQYISKREFYVEGCGQLCCECHSKIFGQNIVGRFHT